MYNNTDRLWYKRDINRYYDYLVCSIYNTEDNHHEIINQYKKTNKIKQETKTSNNQHEHTRKTKDEKHETNKKTKKQKNKQKQTKKNKKTGGEFRCTGEDLAVYDPQLSS